MQFAQAAVNCLRPEEELHCLCSKDEDQKALREMLVPLMQANTKLRIHQGWDHRCLASLGCLQLLDSSLNRFAEIRLPLKEIDFSIVGMIHTLSSSEAIETVANCVARDLYPWDAIVCTSNAGKEVVQKIWEQRAAYLCCRLGANFASDNWMPATPVIPLPGPAKQPYRPDLSRKERRQLARKVLGISDEAFVICFVGRLSFHSKAHPVILYQTLANLSQDTREVVLIECGQFPNYHFREAFDEVAGMFQGFTRIVIGGLSPATENEKWEVYAAANVFLSHSDNIQETFGLTILEAMLAELPVIASAWSGYRDLVADGQTGFLLPTIDLLLDLEDDPLQDAYYERELSYDIWVGIASLGVLIDKDALYASLRTFVECPELGERFAAEGLRRFHKLFSPFAVLQRYRDLWLDLAAKRNQAKKDGGYPSGKAPKMGELFSGYPSTVQHLEAISIKKTTYFWALLKGPMVNEFLQKISSDSGDTFLEFINDRKVVSVVDLLALGYRRDQALRLLTLLVKLGLAESHAVGG
ncbi:glycosyltransferase family 4 protein [Prochlorococcus marinus]|uniref:glycosyltransferase family 4 protein n=1 Tax=Prochlorococcus marinus TaxID=1219 RepID=UPI000324FD1B|nr:glycosyltransferase family 4 protein [Prochlorococcus marinus]